MSWNDVEAMKAQRYEAMTVQQQRLEAMRRAEEQLANEQARQEAVRRAQAQAAEWWSGGGLKCVKCVSRHASREVGGSWLCFQCATHKDDAPQQEAQRRPWDAVPYGEELHAPGAIGTLCAEATHNGGTGGRYFTREEVLLMLRALRAAMHDHHAPTLNSIERMFERME